MALSSLYPLIWNLTGGEKKMVRKTLAANKQTTPSNFLKVYDLVVKHDKGDESSIEKILKEDRTIKNVAATKHQLYHHILEIVSGQAAQFDTKYYQKAVKIDYLIGKSMHKEALRLIDSLKAEVLKFERHHFLADLHYKELIALRAEGQISKCSKLANSWIVDKSVVQDQRKRFDDAYNSFYELYLSYCKDRVASSAQDKEKYQSFINESFMNRDRYPENESACYGSSYFYHTLALLVANMALNKFSTGVQLGKKLLTIIERDKAHAMHDVHQYALILYNYAVAGYFTNQLAEFSRGKSTLFELDWNKNKGEEGCYELFYKNMLTFIENNPVTDAGEFRLSEQKVFSVYKKLLNTTHPVKRRQILNQVEEMLY